MLGDKIYQELEDSEDIVTEDEQEFTPLLSYATEFLCSRNKTIFPHHPISSDTY